MSRPGCIYSGAKIGKRAGAARREGPDQARVAGAGGAAAGQIAGVHARRTHRIFRFRDGPCSFYSGTKALGEEAIAGLGQGYIWRLRIPFDEFDHPRNYLSKLQRYAKVYDNVNSISHRVRLCARAWTCGKSAPPFGIYNVTNPGLRHHAASVALMEKRLTPGKRFEFWASDEEFYRVAAQTPRSNCVLDVTKLLAAGRQNAPGAGGVGRFIAELEERDMNNEETKKQSFGLEIPDWKRVRVPAEVERLAMAVVDAAFAVHLELGPTGYLKALMKPV